MSNLHEKLYLLDEAEHHVRTLTEDMAVVWDDGHTSVVPNGWGQMDTVAALGHPLTQPSVMGRLAKVEDGEDGILASFDVSLRAGTVEHLHQMFEQFVGRLSGTEVLDLDGWKVAFRLAWLGEEEVGEPVKRRLVGVVAHVKEAK